MAMTLTVSSALADPSQLPVARVEPVTDTYFGETLTDRYRWMENDHDPDWIPFLETQNRHTRAVLDALPGRSALLKRIEHLSGDVAVSLCVGSISRRTWPSSWTNNL